MRIKPGIIRRLGGGDVGGRGRDEGDFFVF